jgi:hypothetical protein
MFVSRDPSEQARLLKDCVFDRRSLSVADVELSDWLVEGHETGAGRTIR